MTLPVVIVTSGGLPVTEVTSGGLPVSVVVAGYGGLPVRIVTSGGLPVVGSGGLLTLNLSASTFPENSALNTVIGTLSVTGGSGSYTYSFQSNPGTLFNISGASLRVTSTTIAAGSYPVTIRADNGAGSVIDRVFLLTATAVGGTAGQPIGLLLSLTRAS